VLAQRLRHRVDIHALINTKDEVTGRDLEDWQSILSSADVLVPAEIQPVSGSEFIAAAATQSRVTTRITIRHRSDIRPSMRIWHPETSTYYAIRAILPDPSLRRHDTLLCESGVSDG
jgi:SPP1 family predicted phage head-tail adaptor